MSTLRAKAPDTQEISSFYDETLQQRLRDYIYGNDRITAAQHLVNSLIDCATERALEVGCGLGISAAKFVQRHEWLKVHAVDISPKVIEAANKLFRGNDRLIFEVSDMRAVPRLAPYDLITMLDVYEHIPRDTWPQFNAVLGAALSATGTIAITTPSRLHQEHLARENPAGLQIVDETVELPDLLALAKDVSGSVVYFRQVSIWHTNDYIHAVIKRRPTYSPVAWRRPATLVRRIQGRLAHLAQNAKQLRAVALRRRWVRERLGIDVESPR
jgi:trans-aconitate methyltransferase